MKIACKTLSGLGLAAALLAGCGATTPSDPAPAGAPADVAKAGPEAPHAAHATGGGDEGGEAVAAHGEGEGADSDHHGMKALPVEKRVAFMSGHVEAGLALYRAGAPDQAARHLLHPVSETHAAERAGIDALGFKGEVFEAVSAALDAGKPAAEIEPQLQAAEANMALIQEKAGGAPADIIAYLMGTVVEEYGVGVQEGKITDPGEFQDAYGFSVVALKTAKRLQDPAAADVVQELEALVALWPAGGPLADATPRPVVEVTAQTSKVVKALAALKSASGRPAAPPPPAH